MKTTKLLLLLSAFQLVSFSAFTQLTVSITPGYRFNSGEAVTLSKLNQLGAPVVSVAGTVTGSSLAAGGVSAVHLSTNAFDMLTIQGGYDGSTTTNAHVNYSTVSLGIVAGSLGVKTNGIHWFHFNTNEFRLAGLTNNWLDDASVTTNLLVNVNTNGTPGTNTFVLIGTSSNVGTNGSPTNTVFKLTTLNALTYTAAQTNLINSLILASNLASSSFTSTNTNALSTTTVTFTHGWGVKPKAVRVTLLCVTNDSPFTAGDEVNADGLQRASLSVANYSITANTNTIVVRTYQASPALVTGANTDITPTPLSWRLKVYAERGQ